MSRFATRITVSSAWAGMLQSRLAARAANASLMARSLGDWWDHHAAVNMQTVPSRASPFGLRGLAESRQRRAETRHDARRLVDRQPTSGSPARYLLQAPKKRHAPERG